MMTYQFKNLTDGRAEIRIDGEIGEGWFTEDPASAKHFAKHLKALGKPATLDIYINSPGGSVFDGNAIYSQLKRHTARKTVYVEGLAASIASVIAMAGDEIVIPENAYLMIHRASGGVLGDAADMRKMADTLEKLEDGIISVYAARSGRDREDIRELMDDETWLSGSEAVALGFADRTSDALPVFASLSPDTLQHFKSAPPACLTAPPVHDLPLMESPMSDDSLIENPPPAAESAVVPEPVVAPASEGEPAPVDPGPDVSAVVAASARIADDCARAGFPQLSAGLIARQASAAEVAARLAVASQIKAACQLAKADDRLEGYLAADLDEQAVRADLFALLAARDQATPVAHTAPDPTTPMNELAAAVASYRRDHPAASEAQAMTAVLKNHPELYDAYWANRKGA